MTAAPPAVRGTTFVPSVRECQHRLDRLRDTAQIVADLDRFNAELWGDHSGCGELNAASQRLRELHQLCLHMAANMSGGLGVPPTPPSTRPSKQAAGVNAAAANAPTTRYWQRTPDPAAPLAMPTYNAVQAAKVLDVSLSYFYRMCSDGKVPLRWAWWFTWKAACRCAAGYATTTRAVKPWPSWCGFLGPNVGAERRP